MTTCQHGDAIPAFLCRKCHPELSKTDWTPPTGAVQSIPTPEVAPRDRYGRQLAKGIEPEMLAEVLAEQDREIAAKKLADENRFKELRAETAERKAAGLAPKRRVKV
jgi:hypothetical protein